MRTQFARVTSPSLWERNSCRPDTCCLVNSQASHEVSASEPQFVEDRNACGAAEKETEKCSEPRRPAFTASMPSGHSSPPALALSCSALAHHACFR
jgi:hypothetical protein